MAKKRSIHPSLHNVTQQLNYIFFKAKSAPTIIMTSNYNDQLRQKSAFHLSALEATYVKLQTDSMFPERIRLIYKAVHKRRPQSVKGGLPSMEKGEGDFFRCGSPHFLV